MASNGQLPASALAPIPGGRLEKATAASWLRLRAKIGNATGVWIQPTSSRTAYRTYAEQQYFWNLYTSGRGNLAARPGTSNHGWGTTVDVPQTRMAQLINQYGAEYGWQKRWSDAPSEWWHFKYAPSMDRHKGEAPKAKPKPNPVKYLTKTEKDARDTLIGARQKARKKGGWNKAPDKTLKKAKKAKAKLRKSSKAIKAAAAKTGWDKVHRRERHTYIGRLLTGKAKR